MASGDDGAPAGFVAATRASAACLAELHKAAVRADEPCWQAMAFEALLASAPVGAMIAVAGSQPVGFVLWRAVADEAEILLLAVLPQYRRRGFGRGLLRRALDAARAAGAAVMWLEAAVDNPAPIALYLSERFVRTGLRPAYYHRTVGTPADALVFCRPLTPADEIIVN